MILLFNAGSLQDKVKRRIEEVFQIIQENGFSCVVRRPGYLSYYHGRDVLRNYTVTDEQGELCFSNFGDWLDKFDLLSILYEELVPVCYGSSFAIQTLEILLKVNIYYRIV